MRRQIWFFQSFVLVVVHACYKGVLLRSSFLSQKGTSCLPACLRVDQCTLLLNQHATIDSPVGTISFFVSLSQLGLPACLPPLETTRLSASLSHSVPMSEQLPLSLPMHWSLPLQGRELETGLGWQSPHPGA